MWGEEMFISLADPNNDEITSTVFLYSCQTEKKAILCGINSNKSFQSRAALTISEYLSSSTAVTF